VVDLTSHRADSGVRLEADNGVDTHLFTPLPTADRGTTDDEGDLT
jgi:hypothetical protein